MCNTFIHYPIFSNMLNLYNSGQLLYSHMSQNMKHNRFIYGRYLGLVLKFNLMPILLMIILKIMKI